MSTDPNFSNRLAASLDDAASAIDVREGNPDVVMALGRRRAARQRRALSGLAALAVVAGAAGVAATADEPKTKIVADGGTTRGSLGLTWERVEPGSALGYGRGFTNDRPIYALSTGPGERQRPDGKTSRVLWRSDDGVEWTAATTFGDDLYVSDLATADDRVYAVGTAPATARGRTATDLVVGWSDDGGKTFAKRALPVDWASLAKHRAPRVAQTSVASGDGGVVAVAALSVELDVPSLLPDGQTAPDGWATTDAGVDVLGPPRDDVCPEGTREAKGDPGQPRSSEIPPTWCEPENPDGEYKRQVQPISPQDARGVVRSYTWDELGVAGDLLSAARRQVIAFRAPAGSSDFERVDLPDIANSWGEASIEAIGDGFQLAAAHGADRYGSGTPRLALVRSADGVTWHADTSPVQAQWVAALGQLDGKTAVVTGSENGANLSLSDGNGGWSTTSLADVVDPAVRQGRMLGVGSASVGPFGIAVPVTLHPENEQQYDEREIRQRLLVSRDGRTWDDLAVEELTGDPDAYVNRVTVGVDEVVVAANFRPQPGSANPTRKPIVLVGRID